MAYSSFNDVGGGQKIAFFLRIKLRYDDLVCPFHEYFAYQITRQIYVPYEDGVTIHLNQDDNYQYMFLVWIEDIISIILGCIIILEKTHA